LDRRQRLVRSPDDKALAGIAEKRKNAEMEWYCEVFHPKFIAPFAFSASKR